MKKKIVTIALVVALLATCFGATMAFLTDQKSATNTFTVGSVKIDLLESTLHRTNDAATDDMIKADAEGYQEYLAEQGANIVPGREILKAPYIVNTGKNPAYDSITGRKLNWMAVQECISLGSGYTIMIILFLTVRSVTP